MLKDPKTTEALETFSIITTDPNEVVEPLHDRVAAKQRLTASPFRILLLDCPYF